jgi:hypothetical protein
MMAEDTKRRMTSPSSTTVGNGLTTECGKMLYPR